MIEIHVSTPGTHKVQIRKTHQSRVSVKTVVVVTHITLKKSVKNTLYDVK